MQQPSAKPATAEQGKAKAKATDPPGPTPEQELAVVRRKLAYRAMERLLEHGATDRRQLAEICTPLSGEEMVQVGGRTPGKGSY